MEDYRIQNRGGRTCGGLPDQAPLRLKYIIMLIDPVAVACCSKARLRLAADANWGVTCVRSAP
jgi:hypothetical protein